MTPQATIAGEAIAWWAATIQDFEHLAESWITQELAQVACRRVTHAEGAELFDNKRRQCLSGLLFPYFLLGESRPCFRLKVDNPPIVRRNRKTRLQRPSHSNTANRLYFVPGVSRAEVANISLPVVITEGEKKTLALYRLALHEADAARWLPVGVAGVWSWRGAAEETTNANGKRVDIKGPIADLGLINWDGRKVYIVFDSDVLTNEKCAPRGKRSRQN